MTPPIDPTDWEWIKSRIERWGKLSPEAGLQLLEQCRADRPDLAPLLESMLAATAGTFASGSAISKTKTMDYRKPGHASERRVFARGDLISNRYRVHSCVGSGGMGEVYEVEDSHVPERGALALKTVRSDLLGNADIAARFEREVRHALELAHPNVCRIYDVGRHASTGVPDVPFLTMEFLPGGTLSAWLKDASGQPRTVPESEALPLIRQMVAGLAAIHSQGIIHRDFKPLNVMLVSSGSGSTRTVITDLGLARAVGDLTLTRTGEVPGTLAYLAPELDGTPERVTCAADVYSLGVTMLQMLTGGRSGVTDAGRFLRAAGVSSRLSAVVVKCLESDPAKRYRDAGEVAAALDPKLTLPRLPLRVAALVLVGLSLASGGYYWWSNRGPAIPGPALNWYQRGVDDMQSGSYYAAAKKLQEATRIAPDFAMAHVRLAEAWFALESRTQANAEMIRAAGKLTQEDEEYREGIRLTLAGEYDKAVDSFKALAAHASDTHGAQLALALALERAGHGPDARAIYTTLTSAYPWASLRLAVLDARVSDWDRANPEFDAAIEGFRKVTNPEGETEAIYQRGALSLQAVKLDDARRLLNQVLDRVQSTHNAFQQVRAQIDLSTVELRTGHIDAAIALARQAMQSATDQRVEVLYSRANRGLATIYTLAGDYGKAEPLLLEAARLSRQDSDDRMEAGALALLSDVHNRMGHFTDAAAEAEKALAYYDKQKNLPLIVPAARAAANAYRDLGQFQKAADLAGHALTAAMTTKKDALIGEAHEAVGRVELRRQRFNEAATHLRLATEASTRATAAINIPNESLQYGVALAAMGQFTEAGRLFDASAKLATDRKGFADSIRIERATMEVYRGNAGAAIRLVSGIPPDDSDADQTARLMLIRDAAPGGSRAERAHELLTLDKDSLSFALRRQIRFAAAFDLFRSHDAAGAEAALGTVGDYSEMAELNWRALLLASRMATGSAAATLRNEASTALMTASPFLGYSISNKTASMRLDLRDELREMAGKGSER